MARQPKCRCIQGSPTACYFKPRGVPLCSLEIVDLALDEFEAVRLADIEGLYQAEAAGQMEVSRATFGNILKRAHAKIADALVRGKALRIEENENRRKQ